MRIVQAIYGPDGYDQFGFAEDGRDAGGFDINGLDRNHRNRHGYSDPMPDLTLPQMTVVRVYLVED